MHLGGGARHEHVIVAVHTALWVERWGEDLAPQLAEAARLGFDGAEVSLLGLGDERDAERVGRIAADHGLALRATTGLGTAHDVSSAEVAVRAAGIEHLRRAADLVAAMGAGALSGVVYSPWGTGSVDDRNGRTARSAAALAEVAPHFAERGLVIGVEAVNRFETDLVTTAAEAVAYVDAVGAPNVGIHLDTFHMNIEERSIADAVALAGPRLVHLHVVDNDRGAPGDGHLPWADVADGVRRAGYDGWVGLELFVLAGSAASGDLRIWRPIDPDPSAAAARGLTFVRHLFA